MKGKGTGSRIVQAFFLNDSSPLSPTGKGSGSVETGRHIDMGKNTPVTNLLLTMLERVNVRPKRLGDSTGVLEI